MIDKWEDRWEWLRLGKVNVHLVCPAGESERGVTVDVIPVLEVHQFSRDAGVAEAWLLGQEPYLSSREMGQSVDEVEKLIKRHEAFEKSAATWEERFAALERLTTVRARQVSGQRLRAQTPGAEFAPVFADGVVGSEKKARGRREEETTGGRRGRRCRSKVRAETLAGFSHRPQTSIRFPVLRAVCGAADLILMPSRTQKSFHNVLVTRDDPSS